MTVGKQAVQEKLRYLEMLSEQYPDIASASDEVIGLQARLRLPKRTEHFMSDLHGEYEAFTHIRNSASGAIREKVDLLYKNTLPQEERASLATLIYYPEAKLEELAEEGKATAEWYRITLNRLLEVCRLVCSKYTRAEVHAALPAELAGILGELLQTGFAEPNKSGYYADLLSTAVDLGRADDLISAICCVIKRLVVERLHIVGDLFDRGPRADIVLDQLLVHHAVDIQWGNHDALWMGAAAGSRTCIAAVLNNSITYNNLEVIEVGYGISLRPLALFANEVYQESDVSRFLPRRGEGGEYRQKDMLLAARMHKAIAMIQFKLEGQILSRNPAFGMEDRMLLHRIDYGKKTVEIDGREFHLRDCDFPTVDREDPYRLSEEEAQLMRTLRFSFQHSEKLQRHARFLYAKGGLYLCYNGNLLFHGCIPMNTDGTLTAFSFGGCPLSGKAFLDYAESLARQGYYAKSGSPERQMGKDFLWFLWCGRNSPLFGRDKIATFERLLVDDPDAWREEKNPYYRFCNEEKVCLQLLKSFGLTGKHTHIVNGHVPVKSKDGENPVKANGRLIVIDGGFCRAYQPTTGIAGYTLIYNSYGLRLAAHEPFAGEQSAIRNNRDILSTQVVFERASDRILIGETDEGEAIRRKVEDLKLLLYAFRQGLVKERHRGAAAFSE
jgi:fructose-1,6-bisphosphatase-3